MDDYAAPERVYSLPIMIGGGALAAVLVGIVTAVVIVSQSSAPAVHRKTVGTVPAGPSTAIAGSPTPAAPPALGPEIMGRIPQVP